MTARENQFYLPGIHFQKKKIRELAAQENITLVEVRSRLRGNSIHLNTNPQFNFSDFPFLGTPSPFSPFSSPSPPSFFSYPSPTILPSPLSCPLLQLYSSKLPSPNKMSSSFLQLPMPPHCPSTPLHPLSIPVMETPEIQSPNQFTMLLTLHPNQLKILLITKTLS